MKSTKKPSVLVCVTGQYDCDRLINVGYEKAERMDYDLHVLCVHTPISNVSFLSDEIEYLYQTAKTLGADMTIAFNHDAPHTTADFARKINAKAVITGMPCNRENGFVDTVHDLLPKTQITMVTKQGECLIHSLQCVVKATA
ncbi:MAG: hypothetical protein E7513_04035 [Ruminococcaceae bacterium]|nr:hypothetical protein [Oscillospiraceae bacterium]